MRSLITILTTILLCSLSSIAIAQNSEITTTTLLKQGRLQYEKGEYQKAFGNFKKALETDSTNTEALYYLGSTSIKLQSQDNAEKIYAVMQKVAPDHQLTSNLSGDIEDMRAIARYDAYFKDVSAEIEQAEAVRTARHRELKAAQEEADADPYKDISRRLNNARDANLARLRSASSDVDRELSRLKRKLSSSRRSSSGSNHSSSSAQVPSYSRKMPLSKYNSMKKKIEKRHPDDYATQKYLIESQEKAYDALKKR